MTERVAGCQCGALSVRCVGDPVRISVCHCLDCQRRSGSAFAAQARFPDDAVTITGEPRRWRRTTDSGGAADHFFCARCGTTLFYRSPADSDLIAVAVGCFADPAFPSPRFSVYERRRHPWVTLAADGLYHED